MPGCTIHGHKYKIESPPYCNDEGMDCGSRNIISCAKYGIQYVGQTIRC